METVARQSLLGALPIHLIPNGLDTQIYAPVDKAECRHRLNLPLHRPIILYVAHHVLL